MLSRRSINLDISTKCTLACSKCWRTVYEQNGESPIGKDISIGDFKKILAYYNNISLCGQISDPTMHSKFHELIKLGYESKKHIEIRTAASHRPDSWYQLAFEYNPKAIWIFGIDGLPKDSHKYRIRQDGEKLFNIMVEARRKGINVIWSYIIMAYNENDVNTAKQLAYDNDIKFESVRSSRWFENDLYKPKNPNNYIEVTWDKQLK
jgi:hypothetical protein